MHVDNIRFDKMKGCAEIIRYVACIAKIKYRVRAAARCGECRQAGNGGPRFGRGNCHGTECHGKNPRNPRAGG